VSSDPQNEEHDPQDDVEQSQPRSAAGLGDVVEGESQDAVNPGDDGNNIEGNESEAASDADNSTASEGVESAETDVVEEVVAAEEVAGHGKTGAGRKPRKKVAADDDMDVEPIELLAEEIGGDDELETHWYILKVQVNREDSIRDALQRRVKLEGLERYFEHIVVPTEDVAEFTKGGKRRIVKRKLYPGYIMVKMAINDDTWFAVRETPGIGDFTGSAGKPTPMDPVEVDRILHSDKDEEEEGSQIKTSIPFAVGDRVRVKEGNFQNFEGDVDKIDEAHGLITVVIPIFNRPTPVEIPYWQIEKV